MYDFPSCNGCSDRKTGCHIGCERAAIESILHILQKSKCEKEKRQSRAASAVKNNSISRVQRLKSSGRAVKYAVGQK